MEQHINKIMESQYPKQSPLVGLEAYKHIELTEEEYNEAILWGKQKKERLLEHQAKEQKAAENRRALTSSQWSYEQTMAFMQYRAQQIFTEKPFRLDDNNRFVYELLCYYFSNDNNFMALAESAGIANPSLQKGIFLAGNFGVGKTWLMKLFQKNQRQVYFMRTAKEIADMYQADGVKAANDYEYPFKNAVNDISLFFHPVSGLCIDDIGAEDVKKHMGNQRNVIGDLIENRYAKGHTGILLHATTNLTSQQIEDYYGGRLRSRMREIFNLIELSGTDRRK